MEVLTMDLEVLKKKISTFRGPGGRVRITSDELLMEILVAWENWSGPSLGFYSALGVSQKGFASCIGKAKKLKREGHFPEEPFKEVKVSSSPRSLDSCISPITMKWENGRIIRFTQVIQLVDFLNIMEGKKAS